MNGAESLMRTAAGAGVEICFANPGTTEMPLVAALDVVPGIRAVLGLFEGVCTGAADGWGRMRDRPALTLLHLGPGLANGLANLHNARRAHSPVVNLVGDQASWHLAADAPLTSDIESLASPVSSWVRTSAAAGALAAEYILLRLPHEVKDLFQEWLLAHYPMKAGRIMARVKDVRNGRCYDSTFHTRMRGTGPYAELIAHRFRLARARLGYREPPELDTNRFRVPADAPAQLSLL